MKKFTIILCVFLWVGAQSQDSLTVETLEKISYSFTIDNGEIRGPGAEFLKENIAKSQFTMMGEYHGSYQIACLTEALIPIMNNNGYKTFIAEIGPYSAEVLSEISQDPATTKEQLRRFNAKYNYDESDYTAIPFFYGEEDSNFLAQSSKANWTIVGIDQEFMYGYPMLVNRMYEQIPQNKQSIFQETFKKVQDSIAHFVNQDETGEGDIVILIRDSKFVQAFLSSIKSYGKNAFILEHLHKSIEIYALNSNKKWFLNNQTRVRYMKENLRNGLKEINFDLYSDKAFVKMGGYHLNRGYNPMGLFDIGNTLNEISEFHGNTTFSFRFLNRYFTEDGVTDDMMEEERRPALGNFIQMGKKDSWTIIDLRPMIAGTEFHPVKYRLTPAEEEYIKHYDVVIIPPVDWFLEILK